MAKFNDLPFRRFCGRTNVWTVLRLKSSLILFKAYEPSITPEWRRADPFGWYRLNLHDYRNRVWAPVPLRINSVHFRRLSTWLRVKRRL